MNRLTYTQDGEATMQILKKRTWTFNEHISLQKVVHKVPSPRCKDCPIARTSHEVLKTHILICTSLPSGNSSQGNKNLKKSTGSAYNNFIVTITYEPECPNSRLPFPAVFTLLKFYLPKSLFRSSFRYFLTQAKFLIDASCSRNFLRLVLF